MTELDPKALAGALTGLFEWATVHAPRPASLLAVRLGEHLGADPAGLPVVVSPLAGYERVNFQVALDTYLSQDRCEAELIGLSAMHGYRMGLAELARSLDGGPMPAPTLGAAEYESVQVGDREILCVAAGVWLITDHGERLLLMLRRNEQGPHMAELGLEVMAATRQAAERLLGDLRGLMEEHNVYRGRVLVLSGSPWGGLGVDVRGLPAVGREDIVLPAGVLERVERHTSTFSEHAEQLRAAGAPPAPRTAAARAARYG